MEEKPTSPEPTNLAQTLLIANQTVNVGGRVEWIQTLTLPKLKEFEQALRRASTRHGGMAALPAMMSFLTWVAFFVLGNRILLGSGEEVSFLPRLSAAAIFATPFALFAWSLSYDSGRRHREAVRASDRRWAEVKVEIALRESGKKRRAAAIRLYRRIKARSIRRARNRNR